MPGQGFTPEFDYDSGKPAGSTKIYEGDNWIRSNQQHLDNALAIEHYAPSHDPDQSTDDYGRHDYLTLKEQGAKPDLSGSTNRMGLYAKSDGLYIEKEDQSEIKLFDFATSQIPGALVTVNPSIPSGEIILFEKNTAVTGYILKTDKNDMMVYVGSGTGAGGLQGATDRSGGTWDTPYHVLTVSEMPAHSHIGRGVLGGASFWGFYPGAYDSGQTYEVDYTGGSQGHNHGSTYRPPGRIFTRQQRI